MKDEDGRMKERWELWRTCLTGEDPNTVFTQLTSLIWDAGIFRLIWESRKSQIEKHGLLPGLNVRFHRFIDRNFFHAQVAGIRRLIDKAPLDGTRGVYSLRAVIADISKERENLNRETYLALHNLPYTFSEESNHPDQFIWVDIDEAHQRFDKLCRTNPGARSRTDLISDVAFEKLNAILDTCNDIALYVDKRIAHAATLYSRQDKNADEIQITWGQIWNAHRELFKVTAFLTGSLFATDLSPLAWEAPNMFETVGIPVIGTDDTAGYEKIWKDYRDETESWRLNEMQKLWNVIQEP